MTKTKIRNLQDRVHRIEPVKPSSEEDEREPLVNYWIHHLTCGEGLEASRKLRDHKELEAEQIIAVGRRRSEENPIIPYQEFRIKHLRRNQLQHLRRRYTNVESDELHELNVWFDKLREGME